MQRAGPVGQGDKWPLPHPNDRLAILVASALVKMQVARSCTADRERTFYTEERARVWLTGGADRIDALRKMARA